MGWQSFWFCIEGIQIREVMKGNVLRYLVQSENFTTLQFLQASIAARQVAAGKDSDRILRSW